MSLERQLALRVELEFEPGTWTDVATSVEVLTDDGEPLTDGGEPLTTTVDMTTGEVTSSPLRSQRLLRQRVNIRRGRSDWQSRVSPSSVSITLDNGDGALTPGNPASPYYPHVRRGVPLRVVVGHDGTDYTRFVGEVSSWRVWWPEGDVADESVDYDGVCLVEIEAAGVLANMQYGPPRTPPRWRFGDRNLFAPDAPSRVRRDLAWGSAGNEVARGPYWSLGPEVPLPVSFMWRLSSDILSSAPDSELKCWLVSWITPVEFIYLSRPPMPEDADAPPPTPWIRGGEALDLETPAGPFLDRWVLFTMDSDGSTRTVTLTNSDGVTASGSGDPLAEPQPWFLNGHAFAPTASPAISSGRIDWYVNPDLTADEWQDLLQAAEGWPSESPEDRATRILDEAGFPAPVVEGESGMLMGPQPTASVAEILSECGDVGGLLVEDRDTSAAHLRTWGSFYNQAAIELDASASEIDVPLEVILDSQGWITQVAASAPDDLSVTVTDPDSGGVHRPASISRNVADRTQLASLAAWELHLGTVDDPRTPSLTVDLSKAPDLIAAVTALDEGDIIRIANLPQQWPLPHIDLMIQGAAEQVEPLVWTLRLNCSPGAPWTVGTLALDPPTPAPDHDARLDTEASQLAGGISESDAAFVRVRTTAGPPWVDSTFHADEFPFDIEVGAEVMTVTGIAVPDPPGVQSFFVIRSVNGVVSSHPAGTPVRVAQPLIVTV